MFKYLQFGHSYIGKPLHGYQQKDKESLAAYIHRFKREAKRCNFTNNAATIQIFIKELKNAHTLAAWVYKRGLQTLADAISEVEKLQAAQQLTVTLLPSSTVNVMSSEDDQCFQCQESGHIAWHCLNIRCFDCNEYGHLAVDCPASIPPSNTPAHHKRHNSNTRHCTRSTSRHHHRDRHRYNRSRSQSHSHRYCSNSHSNPHRSHSRSYHNALTEALHITITQVLIVIATTHHTGGHPHIEAPPLIPEIAVDPEHVPHTNQVRPPLLNLHQVLAEQQQYIRIRNTRKLPLMTPSLTTIALMTPLVILKMI